MTEYHCNTFPFNIKNSEFISLVCNYLCPKGQITGSLDSRPTLTFIQVGRRLWPTPSTRDGVSFGVIRLVQELPSALEVFTVFPVLGPSKESREGTPQNSYHRSH